MHNERDKHIVNIRFTNVDMFARHKTNLNDFARLYEDLLDSNEHERYERFQCADAKVEYLCAHVLLRIVLSEVGYLKPDEWKFTKNELGKPFIADISNGLNFSLSHTRKLVACAVATRRAIGVDVERISNETPIESLAADVFTPTEFDALMQLDETLRRRRFFQLWTLKEAYLKAVGTGLNLPLKSFGINFSDGSPRLFFEQPASDSPERWHLELVGVSSEHAAAVVFEKNGAEQVELNVKSILPFATEAELQRGGIFARPDFPTRDV